jgi:small subunit ribosomal protein S2
MSTSIPQFTISDLLEAGVHFGHKTRRWNPKMAPYIFGERNGVHIIDLRQTAPILHQALVQVHDVAKRNGRILFVGTKPQAQDIIAEEASRCGQYYINKRWLGGTLTNWKTISESIRTLRKYAELLNDEFNTSGLKKKERLEVARKLARLESSIGGIKEMGGVPDLIIVVDINKEELALKEAKTLGVPLLAIVDTNCDPEIVDLAIPGNDDSIRAIKLYAKLFADAVLAGISDSLSAAPVIKVSKKNSEAAQAAAPAKEEVKEISKKNSGKDEKKKDSAKQEEAKKEEKPKLETVVKKSRKVKAETKAEETKNDSDAA